MPNQQKTIILSTLIALTMFGMCFAMVPFYKLICKKTGLNGGVSVAEIDTSREVTIQFVAVNNANLPWDFYPQKESVAVHPDQLLKVMFFAKNNTNHRMTVQAIPSFTPPLAAQYFHKIECFCFTQQTLASGESKAMPMVFRIDKQLPNDIQTITLAYTLFDKDRGRS